jgi:hypothetical protein
VFLACGSALALPPAPDQSGGLAGRANSTSEGVVVSVGIRHYDGGRKLGPESKVRGLILSHLRCRLTPGSCPLIPEALELRLPAGKVQRRSLYPHEVFSFLLSYDTYACSNNK